MLLNSSYLGSVSQLLINCTIENYLIQDMFPFSEEAIVGRKISEIDADRERSYYKYTLCGILAHSGAINSGHYYSFIRNTDSGGTNGWGTWTEFNDSRY